MHLDELDYELPEALIAQEPLPERDAARMLVLDRKTGSVAHERVRRLPELVPPSLLIVNDTRVMPARLHGQKPTGGKAELLLIEPLAPAVAGDGTDVRWLALGRASKGLRPGQTLTFGDGALEATVEARRDSGELEVRLRGERPLDELLTDVGEVPLPPYIRRAPRDEDRERYQTVFAAEPGAVAAPTAGLHLSERLLGELEAAGHRMARVTLHVGPGTFAPIKGDSLDGHAMHTERYGIPDVTAEAIREARAEGRPVLAIGTTVVRTLEAAALPDRSVRAGTGATDIFIYPPRELVVVDALLTNFHLPRSTLLALVMAFGGIEPVREAYRQAVRERYRFFSYGDAMLIR